MKNVMMIIIPLNQGQIIEYLRYQKEVEIDEINIS